MSDPEAKFIPQEILLHTSEIKYLFKYSKYVENTVNSFTISSEGSKPRYPSLGNGDSGANYFWLRLGELAPDFRRGGKSALHKANLPTPALHNFITHKETRVYDKYQQRLFYKELC